MAILCQKTHRLVLVKYRKDKIFVRKSQKKSEITSTRLKKWHKLKKKTKVMSEKSMLNGHRTKWLCCCCCCSSSVSLLYCSACLCVFFLMNSGVSTVVFVSCGFLWTGELWLFMNWCVVSLNCYGMFDERYQIIIFNF